MQFTDAVTVAGTRRTEDGYLIAEARAVRTGIQVYAGGEVGRPDLSAVRVYRSPEEVFAADSLRSFTHAPITLDHPKEQVTAETWKDLAVGEVSTMVKKDGEWVLLPLILKDAKGIAEVEGGKRQLSAGYTCELDWTPGTTADGHAFDAQQKNIKINHLAIVDAARAGSQARIGDGAGKWGAAPITPTPEKETRAMSDALRTVVVDGLSVQTTDQGAQAIDKLQKALADSAANIAKLQTDHAAALKAKDDNLAKKDEEIGALKADLKKAQDAAPKPADIDKMVADRAALVTTVKAIDVKIDVAGKTDADLRKAAVAAKLGDEMVKDASEAEIAGMFKAIAKDVKPADPFRTIVANGLQQTNDADKAVTDAYAQMVKDMQSGTIAAKAN